MSTDADIPRGASKPNPAAYEDDSPRSSGIHPREARVIQHMQINNDDTSHQQNEALIPHVYLNAY